MLAMMDMHRLVCNVCRKMTLEGKFRVFVLFVAVSAVKNWIVFLESARLLTGGAPPCV